MSRIIGVVHRVKQTASQEARPTLVCISGRKKDVLYELPTETDELDFLLGRFPVKYRAVEPNEDIAGFRRRQIKWRKAKDHSEAEGRHESQSYREVKTVFVAEKVPSEFDGLAAGDAVVMCLGGSGDRLAYAMARHGQDIGAKVFRVNPRDLKEFRGDGDKDSDHFLLVKMYADHPELFKEATPADLELIRIRIMFDQRMDAMKARIECEQRLGQRLIGSIFLNEEGRYPEGAVEDLLLQSKANDVILAALLKEEQARNRDLERVVAGHHVFHEVFGPITGCGIRIAAPIIAFVGDIRRFETVGAFKQYCGVAPNAKGEFQRKRRDVPMSWRPEIRQALFLLADQFNRRPNSEWGAKFVAEKERLRLIHPETVEVEEVYTDKKGTTKTHKVKKYTNGHIHNMARWHILGKFVEAVYQKWKGLLDEGIEAEAKDVA